MKVEPGEDVEMKEEVKPKLDKINPKTGSPYRPKTAAELFLEHSDAGKLTGGICFITIMQIIESIL